MPPPTPTFHYLLRRHGFILFHASFVHCCFESIFWSFCRHAVTTFFASFCHLPRHLVSGYLVRLIAAMTLSPPYWAEYHHDMPAFVRPGSSFQFRHYRSCRRSLLLHCRLVCRHHHHAIQLAHWFTTPGPARPLTSSSSLVTKVHASCQLGSGAGLAWRPPAWSGVHHHRLIGFAWLVAAWPGWYANALVIISVAYWLVSVTIGCPLLPPHVIGFAIAWSACLVTPARLPGLASFLVCRRRLFVAHYFEMAPDYASRDAPPAYDTDCYARLVTPRRPLVSLSSPLVCHSPAHLRARAPERPSPPSLLGPSLGSMGRLWSLATPGWSGLASGSRLAAWFLCWLMPVIGLPRRLVGPPGWSARLLAHCLCLIRFTGCAV